MPYSGSVPNYMSALELIMYRTAMKETIAYFEELELMTDRYQNFYEAAERIADEVSYDDFYKYKIVNGDKIKNHLYYEGEEKADSILKILDKTIKLGFYNKFLSKSPLRKDSNSQFSGFNPYSDSYFDRYENYRKKFVKVVKCLSENFKLSDNSIKNLFQIYETEFYETNFLSENNMSVIDYTLGLSKGTYFSLKNLNDYENELNHFLEAINAINNCEENTYTSEKQKISFLCKYLSQSARKERAAYIKNNAESLGRPETSNVFLVACLDLIANKKIEEAKKDNKELVFEFDEFSTQNIRNLPKSFVQKAQLVEDSVIQKTKKPLIYFQPTFWGEGFIEEPPLTAKDLELLKAKKKKHATVKGPNPKDLSF
jgi:hypothetical protein